MGMEKGGEGGKEGMLRECVDRCVRAQGFFVLRGQQPLSLSQRSIQPPPNRGDPHTHTCVCGLSAGFLAPLPNTSATMPPPRRPAAAAAAFYARTLPFTAAIVAQWFAIFALLAYVVPHVLCRDELGQDRVRVLEWRREGGRGVC